MYVVQVYYEARLLELRTYGPRNGQRERLTTVTSCVGSIWSRSALYTSDLTAPATRFTLGPCILQFGGGITKTHNNHTHRASTTGYRYHYCIAYEIALRTFAIFSLSSLPVETQRAFLIKQRRSVGHSKLAE
jgi:hypothetical protein